LFDYESHDIEESKFSVIEGSVFGQLSSGELKTFELGDIPEERYNPLFKATAGSLLNVIGIERQLWKIESCNNKEVYEDAETQLWEVIGNEYKLKRGDTFRLGRMLLKIKDYRSEFSTLYEDCISHPSEDDVIDLKTKNDSPTSSEEVCRVCFNVETTEDNPLLSICNCAGSMKYIHYLCLKLWLHSALEEKVTSQVLSYYWKSFHCEICTAPYPCMV
jgi:hypothetical protein